jgi:hypothetical protein
VRTSYCVNTARGLLLAYSTPEQRHFLPLAGDTVRADFAGGALSADFCPLLRRGIARQIGFPARLAAAVRAKRPPSSIAQPLRDLFAPRLSQIASGDADGNEANRLRSAPLLKLRVARFLRDPAQHLARAPTFSRLEPRVTRTDLSRLPHAFVDHCMARAPAPPAALVLDREHAAAPTHGPQALAVSHHHDQRSGSLPLVLCDGPSPALVTACLRPGTRPPGRDKALRLGRRLASRRRPWPSPPSLVRGDRPCATPEGRAGLAQRRRTAFVFGVPGQPVLLRHAAPVRQDARPRCRQRTARARL